MAKKKRRFLWMFFLPFVAVIPLLFVGSKEEWIRENYGTTVWIVAITIFIIVMIVFSLLPFYSVLKGIFGGKGYYFFWGRGKLAQSVLSTGRQGMATVISIGESSEGGTITVNNQPYLGLTVMVEEKDKPAWDVSFNTIIPRADVPKFQPGAQFPVRIQNSDNTTIVLDTIRLKNNQRPVIGGSRWSESEYRLLEHSGIDGTATLLKIEDTGRSKDFKPIAELLYEVYIPGDRTYNVTKEMPVESDMVKRLQTTIGKSYKARILPNDKDKFTVDVTF